MSKTGTLYIVSTPIGNLEDITLRALRVLREVDLIAAEDTRTTRKLLSFYDIHVPITSYFDANEEFKATELINKLKSGLNIALVSEAGTPGISDPAYRLLQQAIENNIPVVCVPGPTAFVSAAVVSGLPIDSFVFIGFLPHKRSKRLKKIESLREEPRTLIMYVSPHRFLETLKDLKEILGDRKAAIARELTKKFEEVLRGPLSTLIEKFENTPVKGEITLVLEGKR
jgi:16S rRNA (cytidine1402-2'-O)-methyltransferase